MAHPASTLEPPAATPAPSGAPAHYRPHLDGLRVVAVYLVVLYHAGIGRFSGGFVGVDVFFVVSGYLVTQLLLRDLGDGGGIDLRRFYARRVRRLLPAAAVVLVTTAVVFTVVGSPAEWRDAEDAMRAAALYVSNWFFLARATDYFAADIATNPVLHFWSLAVEEQFYIAWPLVLLGLHRLARATGRPQRVLQAVVALAGAASLLAALRLSEHHLDRAYFGTDTRAYQLLAGALLALTPGIVARLRRVGPSWLVPAGSVVALAGLGLAATSWVDLAPIQRGAVVTALAVAALATLDAAPTGIAGRILSLPPVVYLGRISYGTYLWHWLVVVVLARETELGHRGTLAVTAVVATGLASLSFQLLEHPVRSWTPLDRQRVPVIAGGLALSLVVGLVAVPAVFDRAEPPRATERAAGDDRPAATSGSDAPLDWEAAQKDVVDLPVCTGDSLDTCTVVRGDGPKVLLVGDSHARMYRSMLEPIAKRRGLELSIAAMPTCGWIHGAWSAMSAPDCKKAQEQWYGPIMEGIDPDIVVLAHRVLDAPGSPTVLVGEGTPFLKTGTPEFDELVEARTRATVAELRAEGRKVVIIEPIPQPRDDEEDPLVCLSRGEGVDPCRFVASPSTFTEERLDRRLDAEDDDVWSLDIDRLACPYLPICDPVVDGRIVRRDNTHLTTVYASSLADPFEDLLVSAGILG
ncbi:MAG: acyltransferase [Actinobacteria bacterium]|nr:acyltransferase [Actinomycetota bacterium]